jgi:hypothetical protein
MKRQENMVAREGMKIFIFKNTLGKMEKVVQVSYLKVIIKVVGTTLGVVFKVSGVVVVA